MGHGAYIYCGGKNNCNKLGMKVQRTGTLLCDDVSNVKATDMEIADYCYDYILLLAESTEITFRYGSHSPTNGLPYQRKM